MPRNVRLQAAVIPELLAGDVQPGHPGDLCVAAPTGSGKTLAYALPIIHCLHARVVRRVRAVVVVPSRDLVNQVKKVRPRGVASPLLLR